MLLFQLIVVIACLYPISFECWLSKLLPRSIPIINHVHDYLDVPDRKRFVFIHRDALRATNGVLDLKVRTFKCSVRGLKSHHNNERHIERRT